MKRQVPGLAETAPRSSCGRFLTGVFLVRVV